MHTVSANYSVYSTLIDIKRKYKFKHAALEHWLAANIQYPTYSNSSCPHLNWHMFAHRCRLHIQHPPRIPRSTNGHLSVAFRLQVDEPSHDFVPPPWGQWNHWDLLPAKCIQHQQIHGRDEWCGKKKRLFTLHMFPLDFQRRFILQLFWQRRFIGEDGLFSLFFVHHHLVVFSPFSTSNRHSQSLGPVILRFSGYPNPRQKTAVPRQ